MFILLYVYTWRKTLPHHSATFFGVLWHSKYYKCTEVIKHLITVLKKISSKGIVFCHIILEKGYLGLIKTSSLSPL